VLATDALENDLQGAATDRVGIDIEELEKVLDGNKWRDPLWRIEHLYQIVDKRGKTIPFRPNDEQRDFLDNIHNRNVILKSRQLGFSTLVMVMQLDQALFNANHTGVVIADTKINAGTLFKKIEFAYDTMTPALQDAFATKARSSKSAIEFEHGSSISVGTSARGGTVLFLHVSELGVISLKRPDAAKEIVEGGFEAVPLDGLLIVESTAEGSDGEFYDICMTALRKAQGKEHLTPLDFKFHFYAWFQSRENRLDPRHVIISPEKHHYFNGLQAKLGVVIDDWQRAWYVKKEETNLDGMKKENPSTPEATAGAIYGRQMTFLRESGRLTSVPVDVNYPVNTFWDLGVDNMMSVWCHQYIGLQHRFWHEHSDHGRDLKHFWIDILEALRLKHKFRWSTHYLPHDAATERLGESNTTHQRTLHKLGMERSKIVPRTADLTVAIDEMRANLVGNVWIDMEGCAGGIKAMDNYGYVWNEKHGRWSTEPHHKWSDPCDAIRQWSQDRAHVELGGAVSEHIKRFAKRDRSWR
jgi:hypothetical protein